MKQNLPGVTLKNNRETTIAFREKGNTVEFALSVMSPEETKFRRKVGEYYALDRYNTGQTAYMKKVDFYDMLFNLCIE